MKEGYWFKSDLFEIENGEDEDTNPGCYGRSLSDWLCQKFLELGYKAEVIPEDWGWCVMCEYDEYLLWIGCGVMQIEDYEENSEPPKGNEVVWHVFTEIEIPFFKIGSFLKKWMGKLDLAAPLKKLQVDLDQILKSESEIKFCEEP